MKNEAFLTAERLTAKGAKDAKEIRKEEEKRRSNG